MIRPPPTSTLFPYTTLFRSDVALDLAARRRLHPDPQRQALLAKGAVNHHARRHRRLEQHQRMLRQLAHRYTPFERERVVVHDDHPELRRDQRQLFEVRQELLENAHREVRLAGIDRGGRVAVAPGEDREPDRGIGGAKAGDRRQVKIAEARRRDQGDLSRELSRVRDRPLHRIADGVEDLLSVLIKGLAFGRQREPFSRPLENLDPEFALECLHLKRNRRRREKRSLGGFLDGAVLRDQADAFQLAQFHSAEKLELPLNSSRLTRFQDRPMFLWVSLQAIYL